MSKPGTSLYVNADWSALVPAGSVEAAFGLTVEEAKRRGLMPLAEGDHFAVPEFLSSANVVPDKAEPEPEPPVAAEPEEAEVPAEPEPEPEVKQAPKVANKKAKRARNK